MNYLSRYNKKSYLKNKIFSLVFVILVIIISFYFNIFGVLSGFVHFVSYPFLKTGDFILDSSSQISYFFQLKKSLSKENEALKETIKNMEANLLVGDLLWVENEQLKELIGFNFSTSSEKIAKVLSKPNNSPYDSLVLGVNGDDIKVGDKVFAYKNILIGEVSKVFSKSSVVSLYSSYGRELNINIGIYGISALATGKGGGNFEVSLPRGVDIQKGDIVYVSGFRPSILGSVEEIIFDPADSFQTILFKTPVNIFELSWVSVLKL
ncbi:rod shape-determining protein MreC [Patescibacteria group bacterium]